MKLWKLLFLAITSIFFACSGDDDSDSGPDFQEVIIGKWQLEMIRIEGPDCQAIFGPDVPLVYPADEVGCAVPEEILGNAKRCNNVEFRPNGEGTFFWSVVGGSEDVEITWTINNDELEYCSEGPFCNGPYTLVNNRLQSSNELRLDQTCRAVYVLIKK